MRMTRVALNCGQHTTFAKYGAKTVKQSTAVMLIMVSMASKLRVQRPDSFGAVLFVIVKGDNGDGARRG